MSTPDDLQLPPSEPVPASVPPVTAALQSAEPLPLVAEPAPAEAAPLADAAPAKAARKPRPAISDETLAEWQAKLAAESAIKRQAARAATAARERAEAFRQLRAALRRLEDPADDLAELRADRLARDVHEAPEHVRMVLAATLRMLTARRGGR